jgi:CMP-N-acetylneuraminic acid synthetase
MNNQVLALIPARGGSKSIPHKNIRLLAGYPLIAYSIASGLAAERVDRVIVSTDDEEIASVARNFGAEVPFLRPVQYAQDNTPDLPVFQHALRWLSENEGYQPSIVVQLRPTSPFRRVKHIDQAVHQLVQRPDADSVRTVCVPFQNPFKMWRIGSDGIMLPLIGSLQAIDIVQKLDSEQTELYNLPRQSLPEVYWQTGYVDAAWTKTIVQKNSMTGSRILPLIMDPSEWIDIDTLDDWRRAERLLENGELTLEELGFSF